MISVPKNFVRDTIRREGQAGRDWIQKLPALVEKYCQGWGLVIDGPVMHGYLGLVVPVLRGREQCVLKVSWVEPANAADAAALAVWNGQGAARLLDVYLPDGVLLLERLDYQHTLSQIGITDAIAIAGRLLRRLAIPARIALPTQMSLADEMGRTMPLRWEQYGRPTSRGLLDRVCNLAARLGPQTENLIVNYDIHYDDVLAGTREPWLAVDPKVVSGVPEFGIAQLFWCRLEDIEANGGLEYHFALLVEAAGLDPELARDWTLVRCLDYWLWGLTVGFTEDPARCERIINLLA